MNRKMRLRDWIVLAGLAALIAAACLWVLPGKEAAKVEITVDGVTVYEGAVTRDARIPVETEYGTNLVVVENGSVWMEEADCPHGECIRLGKISRSGQMIVCLPHHLMVELTGEESEVDVIAG